MGKMFRIHWNRPGYVELTHSKEVQDFCRKIAEKTTARANASLGKDEFELTSKEFQLAKGFTVHANSAHAYYHSKKYNTLQNALPKKGGGGK